MAGRWRRFRFLGCNPLWAGAERLADIALLTANMDVVALAGTRAHDRAAEKPLVRRAEGRLVVEQQGTGGIYENASTGVAIVLGSRYTQAHVKWAAACPAAPGRSLAMRVKRGQLDFCCGVPYSPRSLPSKQPWASTERR